RRVHRRYQSARRRDSRDWRDAAQACSHERRSCGEANHAGDDVLRSSRRRRRDWREGPANVQADHGKPALSFSLSINVDRSPRCFFGSGARPVFFISARRSSPRMTKLAQRFATGPHLALIAVQIIFGTWGIPAKIALRYITPFGLSAIRVVAAAV